MAGSDWGGKRLFSEEDWTDGSEYGGVKGLIAPENSGHTQYLTADEQLMLIYNTEIEVYDPATGTHGQSETDYVPETKKIQ